MPAPGAAAQHGILDWGNPATEFENSIPGSSAGGAASSGSGRDDTATGSAGNRIRAPSRIQGYATLVPCVALVLVIAGQAGTSAASLNPLEQCRWIQGRMQMDAMYTSVPTQKHGCTWRVHCCSKLSRP